MPAIKFTYPKFKDWSDPSYGHMQIKDTPKGLYKCPRCLGGGRIYHPDQQPDVIEGYKMVDRITCPVCQGAKHGAFRSQWHERYLRAKADLKKRTANRNKRMGIVERAMKKLTKTEIKVLGIQTKNYDHLY